MSRLLNLNGAISLLSVFMTVLIGYLSYDTYTVYTDKSMATMLEENNRIEIERSNRQQHALLTYINLKPAKQVLDDFKLYVELSTEMEIGGWKLDSVSYGIDSRNPPKTSIKYSGGAEQEKFYPEYIFSQFSQYGFADLSDGITFANNSTNAEFYVDIAHVNKGFYSVSNISQYGDMFSFDSFIKDLGSWSEFYKVSRPNQLIKINGNPEKIYDFDGRRFYMIKLEHRGDFYDLHNLLMLFPDSAHVVFEKLVYINGYYESNISVIYENTSPKR